MTKAFLAEVDNFPQLKFEASISHIDGGRIYYRLVVKALGDKVSRDQWRKVFDYWCAGQGEIATYAPEDKTDDKTEANVAFSGVYPIIDFLVRWIGKSNRPTGEADNLKLEQMEREIAELEDRMAKTLEKFGRAGSRGRNDSIASVGSRRSSAVSRKD